MGVRETGSCELFDGVMSIECANQPIRSSPFELGDEEDLAAGTDRLEIAGLVEGAVDGNGGFFFEMMAQAGIVGDYKGSQAREATLTLEKLEAGFTITKIHLDVAAKIPGGDKAAFEKAAQAAKSGCPVSKVLKADITMDAKLV